MKLNKTIVGFVLYSLVLTTTAFGSATLSAEDRRPIRLQKNQRVNGYSVVKEGDKQKIVITGVTGTDGKLVNGKMSLRMRCELAAALVVVTVLIVKGKVERYIKCRLKKDPFLYYP